MSGEAADGMETLACVRKGECDVVLLDISMPGKNGIDTLRQLKRSRPDLPGVDLERLLRAAVRSQLCCVPAPAATSARRAHRSNWSRPSAP